MMAVENIVKGHLTSEQPLRDQCRMVFVPVDIADRKNEKPRRQDGKDIERNKQQDRLCLFMRRHFIARDVQCFSIRARDESAPSWGYFQPSNKFLRLDPMLKISKASTSHCGAQTGL